MIEKPKGARVAGAQQRGRDTQNEAGEAGKSHISQGLAGLEEETGFYSWLIGKPLQGPKEGGDSI